MGKQLRGTTYSGKAHEDSHLMRSGDNMKNLEDITWSNLNLNKAEAAARGTQIKRMLGIKDDTPITPEQLKYMKEKYYKHAEHDNTMQVFLDSIIDFDEAAGWLSRNAFSLGVALNLLDYEFLKNSYGLRGL